MLDARLGDSSVFKKVLDAIKDLCKDINIDCDSNGMNVQAMDNSHVSLVNFKLTADAFDSYQCTNHMTLGINVDSLSKIFKMCGSNDSVAIVVEEMSDMISFSFESRNSDKISSFELRLMSLDSESLGIPDTEYTAVTKMPSKDFATICRDMSQFGDTATISAKKGELKVAVKGDVGNGSIVLKERKSKKDAENVDLQVTEPVEANFALRYLNFFARAGPLSERVELFMAEDVPLVVHFDIGDGQGHLKFYLAPKLDD